MILAWFWTDSGFGTDVWLIWAGPENGSGTEGAADVQRSAGGTWRQTVCR